ncbi:hypothetical protein WG908_03475 [Sphingobium sp. AN641]|uniref:hypothetical protein n=1 Tax=Sphingobium sp. AN641 TaxID=3133443 RepID=UPI0030BC3CBB
MTDGKPKKPFALDVGQTSFTMRDLKAPQIRDQDNAAPKPTPPKLFRLDHPRLAPPGMKGITRTVSAKQNLDININVNVRMDQPQMHERLTFHRENLRLGDQGKAERDFKSLVERPDMFRSK